MTARITVSLPDSLAERIIATAQAEGMTVSAWLAHAAEQRLFAAELAALAPEQLDPAEEAQLRAMFDAQQSGVAGDRSLAA